MFSRDFIIRQIQQLTQVLAVVLFHKKAGRLDEAQAEIDHALRDALDLDTAALRHLDRPDLLAVCSAGDTLLTDLAVALADLLHEDATAAGRERALWLYDAVLDAGGAVPLDIHDRLAALRASLTD
jgi:hypothetical protein